MLDWRALTEQRLAGLRLPNPRREEIVQELSEHLEDEFALLCQSLPEDEAQRRTLELLAESDALICEIRKAETEDTMTQSARILLCGILTGAVSFLLGLVVFVFVLGDTVFGSAIHAAGPPEFPPLPAILHVAVGVWTMWLYTSIRSRYGAGPKAAMVAGFAYWVIAVLGAIQWVGNGLIPLPLSALMAPVPAGLPVAVLATLAGAWAFERSQRGSEGVLKSQGA